MVRLCVPGQGADPRLHIVVYSELDILNLGNFARGMCDLVLRLLVLELEEAPISTVNILLLGIFHSVDSTSFGRPCSPPHSS